MSEYSVFRIVRSSWVYILFLLFQARIIELNFRAVGDWSRNFRREYWFTVARTSYWLSYSSRYFFGNFGASLVSSGDAASYTRSHSHALQKYVYMIYVCSMFTMYLWLFVTVIRMTVWRGHDAYVCVPLPLLLLLKK